MIESIDTLTEIRRMRGLRGYPKPEAEGELTRVAAQWARDVAHLRIVVTGWLDEQADAPKPSDLKAALRGGANSSDDNWAQHKTCPHGLCLGDGWRVGYVLHTRDGSFTRRESITQAVAIELRGRLGPLQAIYDGVTKCVCAGGRMPGMPAQSERRDGKREAAGG